MRRKRNFDFAAPLNPPLCCSFSPPSNPLPLAHANFSVSRWLARVRMKVGQSWKSRSCTGGVCSTPSAAQPHSDTRLQVGERNCAALSLKLCQSPQVYHLSYSSQITTAQHNIRDSTGWVEIKSFCIQTHSGALR